MELNVQSFLYFCLLATVAHCAEHEVNPQLKKRLSTWLESRLRRDLDGALVEKAAESEHYVRAADIRDTLLPQSSTGIIVRTKRSKGSSGQSRRQGCALGTCTVHDLTHRLHQLNNRMRIPWAPADKISPQGYGRRRRSLPGPQARRGQGLLRLRRRITDSQIHKLVALLKRT